MCSMTAMSLKVVALAVGACVLAVGAVGGLTACSANQNEPRAVVQGYLDALAKGDAQKALSYGNNYSTPSGAPLLTNEALAYSNAHAPLTATSVDAAQITESVMKTATVAAEYAFGVHQVSQTFTLTEIDGKWYLDHPFASIALQSPDFAGAPGGPPTDSDWEWAAGDGQAVGLTLNGVPLSETVGVLLLPGAYQLGVTNSLVAMTGGDFSVNGPGDGTLTDLTVAGSIALTSDAQAQIRLRGWLVKP